MFKISIPRTPPSTAEKPPILNKPIFKEPVLQSIMFLSMLALPAIEYLHMPDKVFVSTAYFIMGLDMVLVAGLVWKAKRAKRK